MNNLMTINLDGQEREVEIDYIDMQTGLKYPKFSSDFEYAINYDIMGNCFVSTIKENTSGSEVIFVTSSRDIPNVWDIWHGNRLVTNVESLDSFDTPYDIGYWRVRVDYERIQL